MKKNLLTLITMLLATVVVAQSEELYADIVDSLSKQEKYVELIDYFELELEKFPKNEAVLRCLGYCYILNKNLDQGEKYYKEALEVNSECSKCYFHIGRIYAEKGQNRDALDYLNKAIAKADKEAYLYSFRAKIKELLGSDLSALVDHNKAIKLDPKSFEYYLQRGIYNIEIATKEYLPLAVSDFTKAIELRPDFYLLYLKRSEAFYSLQKVEEALNDINKAIELDSSQGKLYNGRGVIFEASSEYEKAIADYEKAIALEPENYLPYANKLMIYYKQGNISRACSELSDLGSFAEKGLVTGKGEVENLLVSYASICNSEIPSYYFQRGITFYNRGEFQRAIDIYDAGLKKFPNHSMIYSFKGNAYMELLEYKKAVECYTQSILYKENLPSEFKENPKFENIPKEYERDLCKMSIASTYFSLSQCNLYLKEHDKALEEINKALKLGKEVEFFEGEELYVNTRGYIHLTQGNYEKAIADFDKSISLNSSLDIAYVNRAIARVSMVRKTNISVIDVRLNNQPLGVNWTVLKETPGKESEAVFLLALADCNSAIGLNNELGYGYYIRGQLKQMLSYKDYCLDLLFAKKLGLIVEPELLMNCN